MSDIDHDAEMEFVGYPDEDEIASSTMFLNDFHGY